MQLEGEQINVAHAILVRWADMESSGRLADIGETQLQGDFLREVFGDALHFTRKTEGRSDWQLEQHWQIPGNGTPDAILGQFQSGSRQSPTAVIELKGPRAHLDRDRFNGRTSVQQCWDYFANLPECRWGVVSNIVSFRLYERSHTMRRYEHFALQDLRDATQFRRFYALLERSGLLKPRLGPARADDLLTRTDNRQREVGDELYNRYRENRIHLIHHLHYERQYTLDNAIAIAQRLIDRIIFIAFCEDRGLLPDRILEKVHDTIPPVTQVTNPRWRNFVDLFRGVDTGSGLDIGDGYNGGLFAPSEADNLNLGDEWTGFFKSVGDYDFRDEVNLEVLGHLFEKSITELEKLREGDFFAVVTTLTGAPRVGERASMPQSAMRKRMGIYYTPPQFTQLIVELTVGTLIDERFARVARELGLDPQTADSFDYWLRCQEVLHDLRICDPACGSGAFLFQAYQLLEDRYGEVANGFARHNHPDAASFAQAIPDLILENNIYGVDLSPEAVEITQLALWIRTARRGKTLADLSHNIHFGNSLIRETAVHEKAFDWRATFPEVFDREASGFDCVIGNPPWERMKLQEREFFSISAPEIATATNAAKRRALIGQLPKQNPELFAKYEASIERTQRQLDYARSSGEYPLTGRGDINTYAVFAELASKIVAPQGRVGLLVPSGIATDSTTQDFFAALTDAQRLICLYDFENRRKLFADVDGRFKFSILVFGGAQAGQHDADFVFFAHQTEDLADHRRHIPLSGKDIALLNPNTKTCPIFRSRRDAEITKRIYRNVPVLIDHNRKRGGNPWGIRFKTMFHQTNDAEHFREGGWFLKNKYALKGNQWSKGKQVYLPVYEAKMVQMYDHRAASVIIDESNWVRQGQTADVSLTQHQNPEYRSSPRFWIEKKTIEEQLPDGLPPAFLAYKDVTSATNQRTMIASFIPAIGVVNSAPLIFSDAPARLQTCLLANLNTFVYDFVARQKVGGVHLNFFIVEQIATLPPERYADRCPWSRRETLQHWISERVLKLTCTAEDMLPLAEACEFKSGDLKDYGGKLHRWNPPERTTLKAELDAAFFILYQIDREDAAYILSSFSNTDEPQPGLMSEPTLAQRVLSAYDWLLAHRTG